MEIIVKNNTRGLYVYYRDNSRILQSITELSIFIWYKTIHLVCIRVYNFYHMGPFNNCVDKMRGKEVKNVSFVHAQDIKTIHAGGGVKKWQKSIYVVVE